MIIEFKFNLFKLIFLQWTRKLQASLQLWALLQRYLDQRTVKPNK